MATLFIGDAWANWGVAGVILAPLYVGILVQMFFIICLKVKKTPLSLAILVYYSVKNGLDNNFNLFIYDADKIMFFILLIIICSMIKILEKIATKRNVIIKQCNS